MAGGFPDGGRVEEAESGGGGDDLDGPAAAVGELDMSPKQFTKQHVIEVLRHAGGQTLLTRRRGLYPIRLIPLSLRHGVYSRAFPTTFCKAGSAAVPESGGSPARLTCPLPY
jgi:hypothetical protein